MNTNYYGEVVTREPGTITKIYRIAGTFAEDHWGRDLGRTDVIIKATSKGIVVEMDEDGYSDMLSDAEYYWEMRDEMEGLDYLTRSAKRVAAALIKAGAPGEQE